uniref:Rab proteins geranylgeranyltransferase component A 1 n=1 Tax=Fundulus heteroclitus TaxID=8078 RepID=A0A3Q2NTG6_FUNHE
MAAEDLPSDFDIVILGTGLAESVVAAACSRVGQRVLHLDRRSYYAANWASFTFNGLLTWIQEQNEETKPEEVKDWSSLMEEGEELIHLSNSDSASITNVQPAQTEGEEPEAEQPLPSSPSNQSKPARKKVSYAQLVKEGRRFNIDLVSKLLFSRGSLVDLLIKSNVSRYAEFKNVTRILTYRHGNVEQVPCSRADVFASRQLSVVEKRKLMRFLTSCMEETEEQTAYNGRPYLEFLRDQQLGESLQHFLLHSIAMVTEDTPTEEGLASTRHFLRCLGRYGNTPFLFPVYGLGEIPQCFSTSCAANMAAYGDDSSLSAFTFIPPVTRQMVSLQTHSIRTGPGPDQRRGGGGVADSLPGEVGDVDEGVVEGGEDVADAEHVLPLSHLRTQADHLLLLLLLPFTRSHVCGGEGSEVRLDRDMSTMDHDSVYKDRLLSNSMTCPPLSNNHKVYYGIIVQP